MKRALKHMVVRNKLSACLLWTSSFLQFGLFQGYFLDPGLVILRSDCAAQELNNATSERVPPAVLLLPTRFIYMYWVGGNQIKAVHFYPNFRDNMRDDAGRCYYI